MLNTEAGKAATKIHCKMLHYSQNRLLVQTHQLRVWMLTSDTKVSVQRINFSVSN